MFCNHCWDHFMKNETYIRFGNYVFCCNTCYQFWLKGNLLPIVNYRDIHFPRVRKQCKNCELRQNMSKVWMAKHS